MMNRAALILLALISTTRAQPHPATSQTTSPTTQSVLAGLSSDDWKVRQTALNSLVKLGPEARPQIESMLAATTDPSVQSDLRAAVRIIGENQRFGPTLFTYHAKQIKPKEAFDELARQANCVFSPGFPNLWESRQFAPMDVDYDAVPFWLAVKDLCDRTNMMINPGYNALPGIALFPGKNTQLSGLQCSSGAFLIVATNISRSRMVNLAEGPNAKSSNLSMNLGIFAEPKLRALRMSYPLSITEAVDEKGNSLAPIMAHFGNGWSSGNRCYWNANIELRDSPAAGQILKRFKGATKMTTTADSVPLEISSTEAKDFDKTVGGVRVKVVEYSLDPGSIRFKLNCSQQGVDAVAWSMLMESVQNGQLRVVDSQDHVLQQSSISTNGVNQAFEINATFQNRLFNNGGQTTPTPPLKLQWEIPTGFKEMIVPFEFKDVPLP